MKDFKRGGFNRGGDRGGNRFGGDRGGFGGKRFGDRGGRRDFNDRPTMHKTTCSECGNMAEVPFKPTGDKPVLCSNCFGGGDRARSNDRGNRRDGGDRGFHNKDRAPQGGAEMSKIKEDIASLHNKMDSILKLLGTSTQQEVEVEKEAPKKVPKREKPKAGELTKAVKKAVKTEAVKKAKKTTKK